MVACGQSQQLGQDHARLRVAVIVGLQPGKDQVELFVFDRGGKGLRGVERIQPDELVVFEMNRPIRALGQRLAQHLLRPRRTARDHDDLALVLLPLAQRLFQRVGIRLVHFVRNIFADPRAAFVQLERRIFLRHLLHANQDFQECDSLPLWLSRAVRKPVSINEHPLCGEMW